MTAAEENDRRVVEDRLTIIEQRASSAFRVTSVSNGREMFFTDVESCSATVRTPERTQL